MSKEILTRLAHAAAEDDQLRARLQNSTDYENAREIPQEEGLELGDLHPEQAQRVHEALSGPKPLTAEELVSFAGGIVVNRRPPRVPKQKSL